MTSWKTTIIGALMAIIVAVQPIVETGAVDWKKIGYAAIIALFGYVAKDANVTGGSTTTPTK